MNTINFIYALLGGAVVAAFWIATILLTLPWAAAIFGLTCVAWFGALAVEDYGARFKRFGR
jgi:hypothetical protein